MVTAEDFCTLARGALSDEALERLEQAEARARDKLGAHERAQVRLNAEGKLEKGLKSLRTAARAFRALTGGGGFGAAALSLAAKAEQWGSETPLVLADRMALEDEPDAEDLRAASDVASAVRRELVALARKAERFAAGVDRAAPLTAARTLLDAGRSADRLEAAEGELLPPGLTDDPQRLLAVALRSALDRAHAHLRIVPRHRSYRTVTPLAVALADLRQRLDQLEASASGTANEEGAARLAELLVKIIGRAGLPTVAAGTNGEA